MLESNQLLLAGIDPDEFRDSIVDAVVERLTPLFRQPHEEKRFASRREMATITGVSEATLDRWTSTGNIPSVMINARRLYEPERVIQALRDQTPVSEARATARQSVKAETKKRKQKT